MSINILHISDLHFGTKKNEMESRYNDVFVEDFINNLSTKTIDYLIISGDVSNESKNEEYEKATVFLNKVVGELKIPKKNVLICMGNHDISWRILEDIEDKEGITDLYKKTDKYKNFEKFYNDFFKEGDTSIRQFKSDPVFVEIPDVKHKVLFLGVNTCYRESNHKEDHFGYIDNDTFDECIRNLNTKYANYVRCLVMHHNPSELADEEHKVKNWRQINYRQIGSGLPFVVFCGHIHQSDGESNSYGNDDNDAIHYVSVGSLLLKSSTGKYNLYTIDDNSTRLDIQYYNYQEDTAECKHYWQDQTKTNAKKSISLRTSVQSSDILNDIMSDDDKKHKQEVDSPPPQRRSQIECSDSRNPKSILEEIRDHKLYYSGHFHWNTDGNGENSKFRSHGYIDINYLVSHDETLEKITLLYKKKIEETLIEENKSSTTRGKTLLVSIGLECSVIGARLSVLFPDFDFSYIPRRREAKDHDDLENKVGFSEYNTVILIRDITFDADESIEIIEERFKNKNIHLISLFYCGKRDKKMRFFGILRMLISIHLLMILKFQDVIWKNPNVLLLRIIYKLFLGVNLLL